MVESPQSGSKPYRSPPLGLARALFFERKIIIDCQEKPTAFQILISLRYLSLDAQWSLAKVAPGYKIYQQHFTEAIHLAVVVRFGEIRRGGRTADHIDDREIAS